MLYCRGLYCINRFSLNRSIKLDSGVSSIALRGEGHQVTSKCFTVKSTINFRVYGKTKLVHGRKKKGDVTNFYFQLAVSCRPAFTLTGVGICF